MLKSKLELPKDGFQGLIQNWKSDSISGFLVFLLALPLSLGIAKASGFPAIAGLYTAIVGGILVSILSGSLLSVKGPAAGLIAIALAAVTDLGHGDLELGYRLTLATIIISGLIQIVFGLVKAGSLADFFPASVVHGMLAAIGIIIISKQIHVMFGVKTLATTPFSSLSDIPNTISNLNPYITAIGVLSLLILFLKPLIKHPIAKIIPGQLIVLFVAVPLGLVLGLNKEQDYIFNGLSFHLDPTKFLVDLPSSIIPSVFLPNFSQIFSGASIKYIILFALVGSIESLLTAKAIDGLDSYKRKANMNKDLLAVGVGNTIAGLLGGLPMISEVARSSNNVSNGAKTRWANFFHGIFLLFFVVIFGSVIELIPNAALAAMLIFTGYNLAAPKEFIHILKVGSDQLMIFVITIFAILIMNDLLEGVIIGILFKFLSEFTKGVRFSSAFKIKLDVTQNNSNYFIQIKDVAVFSNFLGFKKRIAKIPQNSHLIVDWSACKFIDHTFMEGIHTMQDDFFEHGGKMELKGFEHHHFASQHPLASRSVINNPLISIVSDNLNERQTMLKSIATNLSLDFEPKRSAGVLKFTFSQFNIIRKNRYCENMLLTDKGNYQFMLVDAYVEEGAAIAKTSYHATVMLISGFEKNIIPDFELAKEGMLDRLKEMQGSNDIDFENYPEFSAEYFLQGQNEELVRGFFKEDLVRLFENQKGFTVISNHDAIMLHRGQHLMNENEINQSILFVNSFMDISLKK